MVFSAHAEFDWTLEDNNFTISAPSNFTAQRYLYNFDRLRFQLNFNQDNLFATAILDGNTFYGKKYVNSLDYQFAQQFQPDTTFTTQSNWYSSNSTQFNAKVYRLYAGFENDNNRLVVGLQNITMGVGRLWTPTNIFNPNNPFAIEPDETPGVAAINYSRHLTDMSELSAVVSKRADDSTKYALRYKAFVGFGDFAIDYIKSTQSEMLGFEVEGNLAGTGIEIRSEIAHIKTMLLNQNKQTKFTQIILGADYGFKNGISLSTEALYSSKTFTRSQQLDNFNAEISNNIAFSHLSLGVVLTYSFNINFDISVTAIQSFNDNNSLFISPVVNYSINDKYSLSLGTLINSGSDESEFGKFDDTYYLKFETSF